MKKKELTKKEKLMLYGLVNNPDLTDKRLSKKINIKHSTVTSIRLRLRENDYYRTISIPQLEVFGCKMLVVIYTNFSPLIPLQERIKITGKTVEVFDEIFFSIGEQDKGFSLSLSEDYATIGKINDIRTQTFGGRGLLENEYPNMVVFPFEISRVYRFFDFAPLIKKNFNITIDLKKDKTSNTIISKNIKTNFSETEKKVYCTLVKYPESSDSKIGEEIGVSRHTVSRLRRNFESENLIRKINLPDLKKLGFEILCFYHIRFDPKNPPNMYRDESISLIGESVIFMASRWFEAIIISIYKDYDDYKNDRTRIIQILKENKWIAEEPLIRSYSLNNLVFIKNFKFSQITKKVVICDI